MTNATIAGVFQTIADLLEIKGENIYKILAYRKAADSLTSLGRDIHEVWKAGELQSVPGVGKAIAEKIDELLSTGRLQFFENLTEEIPPSLIELLQVPEIGPKKAALFWKQANIITLEQLEDAARAGRLRVLPGIGEKTEARILQGIDRLKRRSNRTPLGQAYPLADEIVKWLRGRPHVKAAELAGSLRRMRATIGDIDLVAATDHPGEVMQTFVDSHFVEKVVMQGDVKSSVELRNGMSAQLWLHPLEEWGTALQYATGSKDHSVRLRELAQARGYSLSDHSLLKPDGGAILFATEDELYAFFGMPWIPPELREDQGEIQAALNHHLPELIRRNDLITELHCHSTWSDGQVPIRAMAEGAIARGYKVLAITDHSGGLGVAGGMKIPDVQKQREEIDAVQSELGDRLRLLQGAEVEIHSDGNLDYPDDVLARLDVVVASIHSGLRQPRETITARLVKAMHNPNVDIIGHPTGRLIPDREGADLDMELVLTEAKSSGVALEINAHPSRLDLEDIYARRAVEMGIPLSINTDAHHPDQLDLVFYGVATARRGWVKATDVINAWSVERLLKWFKRNN